MTNAVMVLSNLVSVPLVPPKISQRLDIHITDALRGRPIERPSPMVRMEAKAALEDLDRMCRPIGMEDLTNWLLVLSANSEVVPTREQFKAKAGAIAEVIGYMPAAVFSPDNRAEFRRNPDNIFFPGAAVLHEFLKPKCRDWLRDRDALRRVLAVPEPPPPPELTAEERQAITTRFRSQMAEVEDERIQRMASERGGKPEERPPTTYLPAAVLASYRANNPLVMAALAARDEGRREKAEAEAAAEKAARPSSPPSPPMAGLVSRASTAALRNVRASLPWNEETV